MAITLLRIQTMTHPPKPEAEATPPYLSIAQVTERLHISKTTLWELRRKGKLRAFHVGRRVLFKSDDVTALVERDGAVPKPHPVNDAERSLFGSTSTDRAAGAA